MDPVPGDGGWKTLKKPNVELRPQADQLLSKLLQMIG
jgi:hypothetical protein